MSFLWLLSCLIGATRRHAVNNGASPKMRSMLTVTAACHVLPTERTGQQSVFLCLSNTYVMLITLFLHIWWTERVVTERVLLACISTYCVDVPHFPSQTFCTLHKWIKMWRDWSIFHLQLYAQVSALHYRAYFCLYFLINNTSFLCIHTTLVLFQWAMQYIPHKNKLRFIYQTNITFSHC